MDRIPPEILLHVFEFLDNPAPSQVRLRDQPSDDMLDAESLYSQPLKTSSFVCKAWRSLVLPSLFRHILWRPKISSLSAFTLNPIPLLRFLEDNQLDHSVTTFTMIVDFVDKDAGAKQITPEIRSVDLEWLWDQLFSVIDPLRFTMIAPPTTLASFLSRMLFLDDAWSFSIPYHILSLARATRDSRGKSSTHTESHIPDSPLRHHSSATATPGASARPSATSCSARYRRPPPCPLFTVRPWTSLLLNEGSSTKVYRTYEFFLRRPPSMLGALLGCEEYPNDSPLIPPTIFDFNYIAIFPLSSHFEILLQNLPRLDRLFVQLTPRPENRILEEEDGMKHIDPADPAVCPRNWALLRVFESGDSADHEVWDMAVESIERSGARGWKVERPVVLVKEDEQGNNPDLDREIDGHIGLPTSSAKPTLSVYFFFFFHFSRLHPQAHSSLLAMNHSEMARLPMCRARLFRTTLV
ncbi:uncharacterized protein F4812DRAFT_436564 [Daldinia caldariorum]|uniref:uncharacterized protein n=1 Tax=Daldinia caldariorum TaxID=326644 RepID=UPI002007B203|nr:uncharacterized protein F4812DRAFT_436564 [Daldinia caldariorum]KAI1466262.1 hypothetical protein F4812DRAFT_436564 [Daldinia caldariorum]